MIGASGFAGAEARGGRRAEGGLTLIEVMVSISVLSVLFLVILRSTSLVGDTTFSLESQSTMLIELRKAVSRMHEDISTARKVYEEDVTGRSYIDRMDFGAWPPISTSLLPDIANLGDFDRDAVGARRVGNFLLLVGEMSPHNYYDAGTARTYRVSVYRLVAYYIADYGYPVTQGLSSFDLVRWESAAFVDRTTLTSVTDPTVRANVVTSLQTEKNIYYAWDPSATADLAFYELTSDIAGAPDGGYQIPWCTVSDNTQDRLPRTYFRKRNAALVANNDATGEAAVPKFAQKVAGNPGFPNGFEVMVIGPSGSRKILARVVAQRAFAGKVVYSKSETIATMRDI